MHLKLLFFFSKLEIVFFTYFSNFKIFLRIHIIIRHNVKLHYSGAIRFRPLMLDFLFIYFKKNNGKYSWLIVKVLGNVGYNKRRNNDHISERWLPSRPNWRSKSKCVGLNAERRTVICKCSIWRLKKQCLLKGFVFTMNHFIIGSVKFLYWLILNTNKMW